MVLLSIDQIDKRPDARAIDGDTVAGLVDSIATIGLLNPIRVRPHDGRWQLIAGAHRLEASRKLGLAEIEGTIVDDDDLHAELAMHHENLCRAELPPSERAKSTARCKAIYLEMHPETAQHVAGANASNAAQGNTTDNLSVASFAAETARATGKDERTVRRDAERGEKVIDEALNMIRGTHLDTGAYLDKLKRLTPNDQITAVERDLLAERRKVREAQSNAQQRSASKIDSDVKARAAKECAEIIAEYVPAEAWDGLKANLYASGAKAVADALTNITGQSIMDRQFA